MDSVQYKSLEGLESIGSFEDRKTSIKRSFTESAGSRINQLLINQRWPWHVLFWTGYALFRFWMYYITVTYYPSIFLEYMLMAEVMLVALTYATLWMYRKLFAKEKYLLYFLAGTAAWLGYLYLRTVFQFAYLKNERGFSGNNFSDIFINNITVVIVYFLFVTAAKYFKDGFISQQKSNEMKRQHLTAEVNNLKSQIAPHFLFNTLNNLYGLAVARSEKLPDLMLRLSDLLRHSLYETDKPLVPLQQELEVLKSYIELESVRMEDNMELDFKDHVPAYSNHQVAPLLLIVFVENAFKHARLVPQGAIRISIETAIENNWFTLQVKNNYNTNKPASTKGIGLMNVRRRLELLYPNWKHQLQVEQADGYFIVNLGLQLT